MPFVVRPDSPFPLAGPYIAIDPDIDLPRQQSWNLGVQQQIGANVAVSATYLGSSIDRGWNGRARSIPAYSSASAAAFSRM